MKFSLLFSFVFLTAFEGVSAQTNSSTPHLIKNNNGAQLIVNGKPFIIMGGELGNSSASSMAYMKTVWPKLKQMNLNTVLAPVYWELLEPEEGKFDFSLVDELISEARRYNLKIVLLWFGTWKNSMSCYVPAWAKTDQQRFPRTENSAGKTAEIITPFSKNASKADKKAFVNLMQHIKAIDAEQQTVLMIQVENEIGMLPEARDHSAAANEAFDKPVPADLINYLTMNKNKLLPEVKKLWEENGYKTSGTWEDVFGKSLATDELFMAWILGCMLKKFAKRGNRCTIFPCLLMQRSIVPGRSLANIRAPVLYRM